jgi:polyisoprenyl-phosphate glycosyltransferase
MIGIVGEYIGKILSELKARPIYFVAEHSEKRLDAKADTGVGERTAAE